MIGATGFQVTVNRFMPGSNMPDVYDGIVLSWYCLAILYIVSDIISMY